MRHAVFIGLGSNLDGPELQLTRAVDELNRAPELSQLRVSSFHWTAPTGPVASQPMFLNGVASAVTTASPRDVLSRLMAIETRMGLDRKTKVYQGPRRIDLDLLFHGNVVLKENGLVVPHPRLISRRFVLEPLMELSPTFVHPVTGRTIEAHYMALKAES